MSVGRGNDSVFEFKRGKCMSAPFDKKPQPATCAKLNQQQTDRGYKDLLEYLLKTAAGFIIKLQT